MQKGDLSFVITVKGRVQGVGFRYSAVNMAQKLGISGYVRNNRDGSVMLEIEGAEKATQLMINWCRKGPGTARVQDITVEEITPSGYSTFEVRYSSY